MSRITREAASLRKGEAVGRDEKLWRGMQSAFAGPFRLMIFLALPEPPLCLPVPTTPCTRPDYSTWLHKPDNKIETHNARTMHPGEAVYGPGQK